MLAFNATENKSVPKEIRWLSAVCSDILYYHWVYTVDNMNQINFLFTLHVYLVQSALQVKKKKGKLKLAYIKRKLNRINFRSRIHQVNKIRPIKIHFKNVMLHKTGKPNCQMIKPIN